MRCPDGEPADIAFLEILTELDRIHPLRVSNKILKNKIQYIIIKSLDLTIDDDDDYTNPNPGLSQEYLLQMITRLKVELF
jgi:hypothetical protein